MARGACVVRGACMAKDMRGEGGQAWWGGMHGGGHAWQERRPLPRTVRILLECILVLNAFNSHLHFKNMCIK